MPNGSEPMQFTRADFKRLIEIESDVKYLKKHVKTVVRIAWVAGSSVVTASATAMVKMLA